MDSANEEPVLGLERGVVRLEPHDPRWEDLYRQEEVRLREALEGVLLGIEHYGSTAVPGIRAKPILDILVGVRQLGDVFQRLSELEALGYEYAPWAGVPGHHVFGKGEARTHLLHVVEYGGRNWTENLYFRDQLRSAPELAAEYDALKLRLARANPDHRAAYTDGKAAFIKRVRDRA